MRILYTTGDKLWLAGNGKVCELPCMRLQQYRDTLQSIHDSKLWKTTGTGAKFTGAAQDPEMEEISAQFCGIAAHGTEFLYTLQLDASGGMYRRELTEDAVYDGHIVSGNDVRLGAVAAHGDDVAACIRYPDGRSHIGLYHLPQSRCTEITEGDSAENAPSWAPDGRKLYFSTSGIARRGSDYVFGPAAAAVYSLQSRSMELLLEEERYDYLCPKVNAAGDLFVIRQPYVQAGDAQVSIGQVLLDVLLFPVRMIMAVGGFLNLFSILFGGQSLRSDGPQRDSQKSKQRSAKTMFFEGNLIKAQKNLRENFRSGEMYLGILPRNRVLLCRRADGSEEVLARAVLDYCLTEEGIVYSNGAHVLLRRPDGSEERLANAELASKIVAFPD
ncbi:MAG: PD40 domain-containing protein [Oscillospiraceae bacterium]|nr:PD40 domain-containing protein [Oscillospiraceae bacterium]